MKVRGGREILALKQVQVDRVDAGNRRSPEVEGAVLKEGSPSGFFCSVPDACPFILPTLLLSLLS